MSRNHPRKTKRQQNIGLDLDLTSLFSPPVSSGSQKGHAHSLNLSRKSRMPPTVLNTQLPLKSKISLLKSRPTAPHTTNAGFGIFGIIAPHRTFLGARVSELLTTATPHTFAKCGLDPKQQEITCTAAFSTSTQHIAVQIHISNIISLITYTSKRNGISRGFIVFDNIGHTDGS